MASSPSFQSSPSSTSISSNVILNQTSNLEPATNPIPNNNPNDPLPTRAGWKRKKRSENLDKPSTGRSKTWDSFTRPLLPDGSKDLEHAQCNFCKAIVPSDSKTNGTSSMWAHGRKCKPSPLYEAPVVRGQSTLSKDNVSGGIAYHTFSQARCIDKCVRMIIKDELPFTHVEGEGFKEFVYELQPRFKKPNRKMMAKGVWELYQMEKGKLMSEFAAHSTRVSITTDTWTSIQNINYMVVTAHFLDSDWNLHKRIINFCSIISHKGEDIGRVLEQCLRQWGINNVFTITVDNATANDSAVAYMKKRLRHPKTLHFGGEYLHLRCACHIINLVVKDGIGEIEDGIEAIWNCVKFIRSSSSRLDKFRDFSVLENLNKNANVPLDVITRWNSTYLMLVAALKYEKVFDRMAEEDAPFQKYFKDKDGKGKTRVGPPTYDDWRNAEAFVYFLGKFYEATLKLSAWKKVTAHILFSELIGLQTEIDRKMKDGSDPILQRVACGMKQKFDKYWGSFEQMNKIIIIANVLDPRWKLQLQKKAFAKVGITLDRIASITSELKCILMTMYDEYKCCESASSQINSSDEVVTMEGVEFRGIDGGPADLFADVMQERIAEENDEISNEVDRYLGDKYVNPMTAGFDLAQWWKVNASTYPILSKLAKDILAIPCSTVASENAFSLGKRVVDPYRSSLTPQMVECLVCSSDWLKATQVNFYKEPTTEEMELYQELEELEKETDGVSLNPPSSTTTGPA